MLDGRAETDARPRLLAVAAIALLTTAVGLGSSGRLTYHEAFVAQSAREMLRSGDWLVPTIGGVPWLEKPPLIHWLVILSSLPLGDVTEATARLPSALAALGLALAIALLVSRHFGPRAGTLAGLVQATTYWAVLRGRLAEADILLAALVAATLVTFDALRRSATAPPGQPTPGRPWPVPSPLEGEGGPQGRMRGGVICREKRLVRLFYAFLGATALAKGIGFGAALALAAVAATLLWGRDRSTLRALLSDPIGLALAPLIALAWPCLVAARYPDALKLWTLHVADRLSDRPENFAGGPWWSYLAAALVLTLPWTPIALAGLWRSLARARRGPNGPDRLLVAWCFAPIALLSLATVKNGHYAIHALAPWSAWTALGLLKISDRLAARGYSPARLGRATFLGLGLTYAILFVFVLPRFDARAAEWTFYRDASPGLSPAEPLVILLDDWDRLPYPTPFGPIPHDQAGRLFYLDRPALLRLSPADLLADPPSSSFTTIARDRDLPTLQTLGHVEPLAAGPSTRWDRSFKLFRVTRDDAQSIASRPKGSIQ